MNDNPYDIMVLVHNIEGMLMLIRSNATTPEMTQAALKLEESILWVYRHMAKVGAGIQ